MVQNVQSKNRTKQNSLTDADGTNRIPRYRYTTYSFKTLIHQYFNTCLYGLHQTILPKAVFINRAQSGGITVHDSLASEA